MNNEEGEDNKGDGFSRKIPITEIYRQLIEIYISEDDPFTNPKFIQLLKEFYSYYPQDAGDSDGKVTEPVDSYVFPNPESFFSQFIDASIVSSPDYDHQSPSNDEKGAFEDPYKYERKVKKSFIKKINRENRHRIKLANDTVCVVYAWLTFICFVIFLQIILAGKLSDSVLIALLTTTTINVIGLLVLVHKYFFR